MGKTKIKTIDDAVQVEELAKGQSSSGRKKLGRQDELVEKLKAELETAEEKTIHPQPSTIKKPSSTIHHPSSKKIRSKKYHEASKDLDKSEAGFLLRNKTYPVNEAVEIVKKASYSKFTGTLEAHINTVQPNIRGLVSLPFASGKKLNILAFDGDDSIIEEINKGKVDFDLIVTTPAGMPKLAKVARILGPRGLMPNPKNGTITNDLKKTVESFRAGKTEYKTEAKAPVIHLALGKLDQPTEQLSANITTLLQTLGKSRVKKVTLSPTMGPSVKLDLASI